jgi:hypothetical protein
LSPFISFVPPGYEMPLTFRAGLLFNLWKYPHRHTYRFALLIF